MKKTLILTLLSVAIAAQAALKDDIPDDYGLKVDLTSQTLPGTVLKDSTVYTVRGHVLINAKANAGQSALKVPVGSAAVIEIPYGCSLTVIGGDAEGQLGAGAGIEVPYGAKLVICGEGKLTAIGGNAAPGERGHKGLAGEVTPLFDPNTLPIEKLESGEIGIGDVLGLAFGTGAISEIIDSILFVGKGGTGGAGGYGGGGAAAGIGGKGGRGGDGGAATEGKRVVPGEKWAKHPGVYEQWFELLGWEDPYLYAYANGFENIGKNRNRLLDGATGNKGEQGANGMLCGEIIVAEEVKVAAYPGQSAVGGASGRCGKAYSTFDLDYDNSTIGGFLFSALETGVELAITISSGGANKLAEDDDEEAEGEDDEEDEDKNKDDDDEDEEDDEDSYQKLWFYGGGGGAGGAGGAAALNGIGPGGAGGGGGGAGGSGLFIVGSNLADELNEHLGLEANGHGGLGGEAYIPANADEAMIDAIKANNFGQDANALNGGESLGQEPEKSSDPEEECFNLYTNAAAKVFWEKAGLPERKRLGCWTTNLNYDNVFGGYLKDDCFAYAGLPGLGGHAGAVNTNYNIYKSSDALVVSGLDMTKKKDFSGKVFCKLTLVLGDGQPNSEDYYVCGTAVSPCRVPSGTSGKVFAGFFTKEDGKGRQYFDKFGNPAGFPFITGDTTLYAHWVEKDVDLGIRDCIYHEGGSFTNECVTFETGKVHYFKDDAEYGNAELSLPGARISGKNGETAVFYIPEGVEVSFTGGDGKGVEPGYPGIEVPEGLTLVITGGGRLIATGGDAGEATDGANGENGYYTGKRDDSNPRDNVLGGAGGAGGNGAGGAAPAIGGRGGRGGAGGARTPGNYEFCWPNTVHRNGNDGKPGTNGTAGAACGNVSIVGTLSVVLHGGYEAAGGAAGKTGTYMNDAGSGNLNDYSGTGGGGGGGGAGAPSALTIGGGIGGGGGGAGGGSGSTLMVKSPYEGYGGSGAAGVSADGKHNGQQGELSPSGYYFEDGGRWISGGRSLVGGAAGANGANGTYSRGLNLDVTAPDFGDREQLGDTDYVFGHPTLQRTITFTFRGEKVGSVLAMVGEALPSVIADQLEELYGFEFAGAYLVDEKGEPVLDELGLPDWWYDEYGYGEKAYDAMDDVTLEVHFEPKWEKAAEWPEMSDFVYDGTAHRVLETIAADAGFTVKSGTLSAVDAGVYSVELQMKDGYEVWSDAETIDVDVATNAVRTWKWAIRPAEVDVAFENQAYDWNATNAVFGVTGKVPAGMTVDYRVTDLYASGVFEVAANVKPETTSEGTTQWNYLPKRLSAVYTVPRAIDVKKVRSFCETNAAMDFTLDEASIESILKNYTNITVCAAIETNGRVDLENAESVKVLATFPTSEAYLGYGTVFANLRDAFPNYCGTVWTWFAIDGIPASEVNPLAINATSGSADRFSSFRYETVGATENIVFTIKDTVSDKMYRIDYRASEADEWTEGALISGMDGSTEIAAPYLGEKALYRLREVESEK